MTLGDNGWIYAIREVGTPLIKIGCTANLVRYRLQSLRWQFKIPLETIAQVLVRYRAVQVEHRIHHLLAAERIQGEWFYLHMTQDTLQCLVTQAERDVALWLRHEEGRRMCC